MPNIDLSARAVAVTYNAPGIPPKVLSGPLSVTAVELPPGETPNTAQEWRVGMSLINPIPTAVTDGLNTTLETLTTVINVITPILGILEYFISTFNSFASVLQAIIKMTEVMIDKWVSDLESTGVYVNVLVPPAYLTKFQSNIDFANLGNGGYKAFIDRLTVSMYNEQDPRRPQFSDMGTVGGYILMIDVDTMDEFLSGVKLFQKMFNLDKLLSMSSDYPAPVNVKAEYGLWPYTPKDDAERLLYPKNRFGIKLTWDPPPLQPTAYKISRSDISGGVPKVVEIPITEMNLVDAVKVISEKITTGRKKGPTEVVQAYEDSLFNNGSPVIVPADLVTGGGTYFDFDINVDDDGPIRSLYYYIVQAGSPILNQWGIRSPEARGKVEGKCISPNSVKVIDNGNGNLEYASIGYGGLGMWSSIQPFKMIPILPEVVKLIKTLLNNLAGATKHASKAFVDFINGIKKKIEYYVSILQGASDLVKLALSINAQYARIATLEVTPQAGGTENFLSRVQSSQPPEGTKFSNSTGVTMGIVMVYGTPSGLSGEGQAAFEATIQQLSKVFSLMNSIFGGSDKRPPEVLAKIEAMNKATEALNKK